MSATARSENVVRYFQTLRDRTEKPDSLSANPAGGDKVEARSRSAGPLRVTVDASTTFGLIELLLKDQPRLNALARSPEAQRELIPRLLFIGLGGYAVFAVVLSIIFDCARVWPSLIPIAAWLEHPQRSLMQITSIADHGFWRCWLDGSALKLIAADSLGLIGAIGVCLPSFYFYGLLSGVRTTMLQVTTNALNGLASGAIAVLGALPIYLALMLGLVIFGASPGTVSQACFIGLALPFITGLYGTRALYVGFLDLCDTLPEDRRYRRTCFLRRLLFSWSACYTAVTPVMIFTLWEYLSR